MLSPEQITAIYCIVDDLLKAMGTKSDKRALLSDAEIILVGLIASFQHGGVWTDSLHFLFQYRYFSRRISKSRLSRRLQRLEPLTDEIFKALSQNWLKEKAAKEFILDSTPLEVCDNIRIRRCKLLQGEDFRGYKASFRRYFYGLRLQLVTTSEGMPIAYTITEGAASDNIGMHELEWDYPLSSKIYADAAYTDYVFEDELEKTKGILLLAQRKANSKRMRSQAQENDIQRMRKRIETVFSLLKNMFKRKLQAGTIEGYMRKIKLFILAFQIKFSI